MEPWQVELLVVVVKILVIFSVLLGLFSAMTYIERRALAFMQFRLGPNRTGPQGILQPVADGIKLFFKEETMPAGAAPWAFVAAPLVSIFAAFMAIAVIPYGGSLTWGEHKVDLQIADLDVGILYVFALASLGVYGIVLAGWSANSKYSLIGGLRSSAQMFSYELSLGIALTGVIMLTGSFRIQDIVKAQEGWFVNWYVIKGLPLGFVVYFIAACAEVNRTPFDLPEAETELVAGFHTEYSSMKFALLQMAEYVNMITVSALTANLFLGGWNTGLPFVSATALWGLVGVAAFSAKALFVLFVFIWLRGTVPRFRYDQLMHFGWKVLVPLAVVNTLATAGYLAFSR